MTNRSIGEEEFAQTFQFKSNASQEDQEELRDFFYKFAHNYNEAQEYLQILKQVDNIEYNSEDGLLYRIHGMSLQCFSLSMRRMTDNISERSLQKLITKVVPENLKNEEIKKIKNIYSHYCLYLNTGVAHQDKPSYKDGHEAFPNSDVIEKDMKHLEQLYLKLVLELCSKFISIEDKPYNYSVDLQKIKND